MLGQSEIRDSDIDRFQIENPEVVPGLREIYSSNTEIDSINSSVLTSASSEMSTLSNWCILPYPVHFIPSIKLSLLTSVHIKRG